MKKFVFRFKRKALTKVLKCFSLGTMMFVFQACYGSRQSYGLDVCIEGTVLSSETGQPIKGIKVILVGAPSYEHTDSTGYFRMYTGQQSNYNIQLVDVDGAEMGFYAMKDTTVNSSATDSTHLMLNVSLNKVQ